MVAMLSMGSAMLSSVACRAQTWPEWQRYADVFVSPQGRVIDPQGGERTTSEAQAYAMFFALVANDRRHFDQLLGWTRDNLSEGDITAHLPGWLWGKAPDGQWRVLDKNAASDADLWMSYTLFEAGRLWQNEHYTVLGQGLARQIASQEVAEIPGVGAVLLPGPQGFHSSAAPSADTWILNPSYTPLPVLMGLGSFDSKGPWLRIAQSLPGMLKSSARQGFAMDWVSYSAHTGFAPAASPGHAQTGGSYDAIRVYLWAGMSNPETPGSKAILDAVNGMANCLKQRNGPPERIGDDGQPQSNDGPVGFSAALLPYLEAGGNARAQTAQSQRVAAALDAATGMHTRFNGGKPVYYDENLVMFGQGWEQRRFRFGTEGELKVTWKKA